MKLLDYELEQRGEGLIVTFPILGQVPHATSTRVGGFSRSPYDSLNLGRMSGDDLETVERNRNLFSQWLGIPIVQNLKMDHGTEIATIRNAEDMQKAWAADACITQVPGLSLSLTTADCVPVFYFDPEHRAIALAHAGWRGTVEGLGGKVVRSLYQHFATKAEQLLVAIGPSIGPCCFEVGEEVWQRFHQVFGEQDWIQKRQAKWHIGLHQAIRQNLLEAGIPSNRIRSCDLCTSCRSDLFFSWRRDQGVTGRMLSAIGIQSVSPS